MNTPWSKVLRMYLSNYPDSHVLTPYFSVKLPGFHADSLKKHDEVATVEEDKEVKTQWTDLLDLNTEIVKLM